MAQSVFLMWYDDNPKVPTVHKIQAAIDAYRHRFRGASPNLVLVNEAEVIEHGDIHIRGVNHIARNTYWVGIECGENYSLSEKESGR